MKKVLYVLMIVTLAVSVYGCSKSENEDVKASEGGVIEEQEEMIYPNYWVTPGVISNEDVEVGKDIVYELFYQMYNRGIRREINEKASERIQQLLYIPDGIDGFLEGGNRTLRKYITLTAHRATINSARNYESISGNQTIVYKTTVEFIANGKTEIRDFEVTLLKKYDKLFVIYLDEID